MPLKLENLKPVGGYLRYGFSVYPWGAHALSQFVGLLVLAQVQTSVDRIQRRASLLSGGHKLCDVGTIVIQPNLVVISASDSTWQVAFSDGEERYLAWLEDNENMTYDFYKKSVDSYAPQG